MQDMTKAPVELGDYLIDGRGRIHVVTETDPSIQASKIIYTNEVRIMRGVPTPEAKSFVREGFCLKIDSDVLAAPLIDRQNLYQRTFASYRAPEIDAENAEHRAALNKVRQRRNIKL